MDGQSVKSIQARLYLANRKKKESSTTYQCQKCLQYGHYTYECKGTRKYLQRPSRSKIMKKKTNEPVKQPQRGEIKAKRRRKQSSTDSDEDSSSSDDDEYRTSKRRHGTRRKKKYSSNSGSTSSSVSASDSASSSTESDSDSYTSSSSSSSSS